MNCTSCKFFNIYDSNKAKGFCTNKLAEPQLKDMNSVHPFAIYYTNFISCDKYTKVEKDV